MLKLRVLGGLEVERDGRPAPLPPSKKARALLALLALSGRPQRRERLVPMFWEQPDDPKGALRWTLSKLRAVVDDETVRLAADGDAVALRLDGVEVDLLAAKALAAAGLERASPDALEAAAASFSGELLAGLELPNCPAWQAWLIAERERAAALRERILEALLRRLAEEPARLLPHARAAVEREPQRAAWRAALIRGLAAAEGLREAEQHYREGARLLADDPAGLAELRQAWSEAERRATSAPPAASAGRGSLDFLTRPAVAVLPFENIGGDPAQDYLVDGFAGELITSLCQWRWFPVIARNSSFAFRGSGLDAIAIGRQLNARYLVQGSVQRAGERIRVTVHWVNAADGSHLWAQRFDRELGDVFALQDELTEKIVAAIQPEVVRAERMRANRTPRQDLKSWQLNLQAIAHIYRGGSAALSEALRLLDDSLALSANSSRTHSIRSYCLYQRALLSWSDDPVAAARPMLEAARRALELDGMNWLAHAVLGMGVMWNQRDYAMATEAGARAVELNPCASLGRQFLGCILIFDGRPAEAIPHLEAALQLNPKDAVATLLNSDLALSHLLLGEHDAAIGFARRAIAEFDGDVRARQRLVSALGHLGRRGEAAGALDELLARQKGLSLDYMRATYPFRCDEHLAMLLDGLRRAGWKAS